ncbi:MAG: type transport system permease protein [Frankiales bacterium]|jgi:ABC-2 type transport system permease protein|nr:type transport system permease protein [Frankiales bacterium]
MRQALHAEWTKLRTDAAIAWLVLASVAPTVALSAAVAAARTAGSADLDTTKLSLVGVDLGQATVAILGVTVIGGEYATGMIRTTLTAIPRRIAVLATKAATLTAVVVIAATVAVLGSLLAAGLVLPSGVPLSLTAGSTVRAAAGSVLYLALIALLSLGVAFAVRDSAVAIGVVLSLLYLFPILIQAVSDQDWQRHLQQIAPMNAGLAIQNTVHLRGLPISPWSGLGVLAAWAAAALVLGGLTLRLRDA